jgi:hypothetical protein
MTWDRQVAKGMDNFMLYPGWDVTGRVNVLFTSFFQEIFFILCANANLKDEAGNPTTSCVTISILILMCCPSVFSG